MNGCGGLDSADDGKSESIEFDHGHARNLWSITGFYDWVCVAWLAKGGEKMNRGMRI
jgi:hypothetical protein